MKTYCKYNVADSVFPINHLYWKKIRIYVSVILSFTFFFFALGPSWWHLNMFETFLLIKILDLNQLHIRTHSAKTRKKTFQNFHYPTNFQDKSTHNQFFSSADAFINLLCLNTVSRKSNDQRRENISSDNLMCSYSSLGLRSSYISARYWLHSTLLSVPKCDPSQDWFLLPKGYCVNTK